MKRSSQFGSYYEHTRSLPFGLMWVIPLLVAGLIIFNTMLNSIAERKGEIHVYTSLGLAPFHVGAIFLAEAVTYGLLGGVFGYIVGQGCATIFSALGWMGSITLNYSGTQVVITMALVIYTGQPSLWDNIPWWVIAISALAISSGTATGGWRIIQTLGMKVKNLRPVHGFAVQASAATVIEVASHLGIPVSTTHCVSSSIMGVWATRRLSAVRWGVAGNIITAWILTFPICGGLGYLFAWLLKLIT